jgi:hypothetical protein
VFRAVVLSRPALAAATVLGIGLAAEWIPGLGVLRILSRDPAAARAEPTSENGERVSIGEVALESETRDRPDLVQPEHVAPAAHARGPIANEPDGETLPRIDVEEPPVRLLDAAGSLRGFYRALDRSARKEPGAITRILYHGDSVVASDYISGTLRRKLQAQFGDSGHGFVLMANAWPAYFHNDVFRFSTSGWSISRVVGPYASDGLYGLGGVSFKGPPGIRARFGSAKEGNFGRRVSSFEVAYLNTPGGGDIDVLVDGAPHSRIVTDATSVSSGFHRVDLLDGEHMLELVTLRGMVRAFGVVLERQAPGVVLDAIGIQGARIRFLDKQDDAHWAEQLARRQPALLIFHFGANESGDGILYPMEDYRRTTLEVLRQAQRAVPGASCLILGALDRARKVDYGMITVPIIPSIVETQERTAAEAGCAFWNTYQAMGGNGSMAKWVRRGLGQADLTHPSSIGADILGNWIYQALMKGYAEYRVAGAPR